MRGLMAVNVLCRCSRMRCGAFLRTCYRSTSGFCSQERHHSICVHSDPAPAQKRLLEHSARSRVGTVHNISQKRLFWKTLNRIVNKPDYDRIAEVGKQRACAEWLVRTGAHVRWQDSQKWERDFNTLPPDVEDNFQRLKIAEVNAVDASVMFDGFVYFDGVDTIKKMRFHECPYFGDDEATGLYRLKDSLHHLEISGCDSLTDKGVMKLSRLTALKTLKLRNLRGIKHKKQTLESFRQELPTCEVTLEDVEDPSH